MVHIQFAYLYCVLAFVDVSDLSVDARTIQDMKFNPNFLCSRTEEKREGSWCAEVELDLGKKIKKKNKNV